MKKPTIDGIGVKKRFGQHFLKDKNLLNKIVDAVNLSKESSVFEIGGGSGFLTQTILERDLARLWVFEIDSEWAEYLEKNIHDPRLKVFLSNILDEDFAMFNEFKPWTLIANLPYQVTFPILYLLVEHINILKEGVIMIQEEVAQKILRTYGRDYGYPSLYLQYHFNWKLLDKVPPSVFYPPPKVYSRVLYFEPKKDKFQIPKIDKFWKFIKMCFHQPRRTLGNNLKTSSYELSKLDSQILNLRAQQMSFEDLLGVWRKLN
jgi:16S rRNA (adenine1518-N6/adenine1519-N6)-dimethyltransferase